MKITCKLILTIFLLTLGRERSAEAAQPKKKVIIDCDPGGDDAAALILLLRKPELVDVLALMITHGNTYLEQATRNALRVLKLMNRLDIPLYLGATNSLTNQPKSYDNFFGADGFGDFVDDTVFDFASFLRDNKRENATVGMRKILDQHPPKTVTLLVLGPMSNLALILKDDPDFGTKFLETIVLGGNYKGIGNVRPTAEFNFYEDPEAANEVVKNWKGRIFFVTWELCLNTGFSWEWYDGTLVGRDNIYSKFLKNVGHIMKFNTTRQNIPGFTASDQLAAAILIDRAVVKKFQKIDCEVNLSFDRRGENMVDWGSTKPDKFLYLITEFHYPLMKRILSDSTLV